MNAVYVCGEKDIVCGDRPENWCEGCPKKTEGSFSLKATYDNMKTRTVPPVLTVRNLVIPSVTKTLYVFLEDDKLYVSSVAPVAGRPWEEIEKDSFEVPVAKGWSLEGARNIVANVLRNGGANVDTSY